MAFEFDVLVVLGRFQPVHVGHVELLREALNKAQEVLVLVGSAGRPRCIRNPFSFREREIMLREAVVEQIGAADEARLSIVPVQDSLYLPYRWQQRVQRALRSKSERIMNDALRFGVVTVEGETSALAQALPWLDTLTVAKTQAINASDIRRNLFSASSEHLAAWFVEAEDKIVPKKTLKFLRHFAASKPFPGLQKEYAKITGFIASWHAAPYTPTFNTCDALLTCGGHVLLIQRDQFPGEGLWAMPGGFIDPSEAVEKAVLRELEEETGLVLGDYPYRLIAERRFDYPFRSARGRVFTQLYHFDIPFRGTLPTIKASDDARNAKWVALGEVRSDQIFEDHYDILDCMLSLD
ncbi:MAG TPA: NUDIX domain-containing protein [Pseudomonadales bacterium]|nr:NUDIX domain-containing protein [Pseudomonadales bacterium]